MSCAGPLNFLRSFCFRRVSTVHVLALKSAFVMRDGRGPCVRLLFPRVETLHRLAEARINSSTMSNPLQSLMEPRFMLTFIGISSHLSSSPLTRSLVSTRSSSRALSSLQRQGRFFRCSLTWRVFRELMLKQLVQVHAGPQWQLRFGSSFHGSHYHRRDG